MVRMLFLLMSFKTSCIDFVIFCSYLRDAMLPHVLALCLSVTSWCSIEVIGRIDLFFSFDQSYTVLKEIQVSKKGYQLEV